MPGKVPAGAHIQPANMRLRGRIKMRIAFTQKNQWLLGTFLMLVCAHLVYAHIRIYPNESTFGAREKYTMRVPNEKQVPTIRVEGEFPSGVNIYDFEFKPGWKLDFKK